MNSVQCADLQSHTAALWGPFGVLDRTDLLVQWIQMNSSVSFDLWLKLNGLMQQTTPKLRGYHLHLPLQIIKRL